MSGVEFDAFTFSRCGPAAGAAAEEMSGAGPAQSIRPPAISPP